MGDGRRKLFEILLIVLIINVGLVGVPSAYSQVTDCKGQPNDTSCDDGNSCHQSTCQSEVCQPKDLPDGTSCDGNSCTSGGTCSAGVCTGGKAVPDGTSCGSGISEPTCNPDACVSGVCTDFASPKDGTSCGSGLSEPICNPDACSAGVCTDFAQASDGTSCNDGLFCSSSDICKVGTCVGGTNTCAVDETCNETENVCVAGPVCGDAVTEDPETCDDGNTTPGDGCSDTCTLESGAVCGDGVTEDPETCDDGNTTPGDGCSDTCTLESVECSSDADCATNEVCEATTCVPAPSSCSSDTDCGDPNFPICDANSLTCVADSSTCISNADCSSGKVCDTNTSTCIQQKTEKTSGKVIIEATCGLAFFSGNPVAYPPVLPGGISAPEQQLVLDNTGNTKAALMVQGGDWIDGGGAKIMNVGDTKYAITAAQDYLSLKTALTGADVVVTAAFDPVINQDTFWQLQANLLDDAFVGELGQTMDFTVTC